MAISASTMVDTIETEIALRVAAGVKRYVSGYSRRELERYDLDELRGLLVHYENKVAREAAGGGVHRSKVTYTRATN